ncbi:GNAT family N-acetyltransferase [Calothrix sp. FACHB-1219]|uniref:aminoglycoside 6'-N-acetyltransferase n=1 Tax=unclassified Calothrix TaxID=2619626 RepID=UPI001682A03C|nr:MULTISPECIES: aminoglycoside 6'-N-acetyltransferase [unclassified Calothrix]MBD2207723.1 GNAT family N-acetyltransferase [Calothrix sp. FACHB-168]MBD2219192.1 GNAT family N-acetyltransferase [Calothrix sp. FACHB-1219]
MKIFPINQNNFDTWLNLTLELWPDESPEERRNSLITILQSPREAGFLIADDNEIAIGFMNLSLRYDYVPGATTSPVAYLEGIYLKSEYRRQGIGRYLIEHAQQWGREKGCLELASDALLDNTASYEFHCKVGFQEVERIVTFIKVIDSY